MFLELSHFSVSISVRLLGCNRNNVADLRKEIMRRLGRLQEQAEKTSPKANTFWRDRPQESGQFSQQEQVPPHIHRPLLLLRWFPLNPTTPCSTYSNSKCCKKLSYWPRRSWLPASVLARMEIKGIWLHLLSVSQECTQWHISKRRKSFIVTEPCHDWILDKSRYKNKTKQKTEKMSITWPIISSIYSFTHPPIHPSLHISSQPASHPFSQTPIHPLTHLSSLLVISTYLPSQSAISSSIQA